MLSSMEDLASSVNSNSVQMEQKRGGKCAPRGGIVLSAAASAPILAANGGPARYDGWKSVHFGSKVVVGHGARLNGSNIVFRDNASNHVLHVRALSQAQLENVWFLNNRNTANSGTNGSALTLSGGFFGNPTVRITNAIFQGNSGAPGVVIKDVSSTLEFNGCLTFSGNVQADGVTAATNYNGQNITDSSTGACPAAGFSYWLSLTPAPTSASKKQKKQTAVPCRAP